MRITAAVPGPDLDRTFEVPVYRLEEPLRSSLTPREEPADRSDLEKAGVRISRGVGKVEVEYGYGRYGAVPALLAFFGLFFAGMGLVAGQQGSDPGGANNAVIFVVCVGGGGLLVLYGLYLATNKLKVTIDKERIRRVRRVLLLVPRTSEASVDEIVEVGVKPSVKLGSGAEATPYYTIKAKLSDGHRFTLGDGIRSTFLMEHLTGLLRESLDVPVVTEGSNAPVAGAGESRSPPSSPR